jgi:hypothetical protein
MPPLRDRIDDLPDRAVVSRPLQGEVQEALRVSRNPR